MVLQKGLFEFIVVLPASLLDHLQTLSQFFQLSMIFTVYAVLVDDIFENFDLFVEGLCELSQSQWVEN